MRTIKYFIVFFILNTVFLQSQVGINTSEPQALLDIYGVGNDTDGVLVPIVNKFSSVNPSIDQNGMLVFLSKAENEETSGFEGFYFWDDENKSWQYIFQSKVLKMNLYKTIVQVKQKNAAFIIPSGINYNNVWSKTYFDEIESPNANFQLDDGDLVIGKTGNYSVFLTAAVSKGQGSVTATQTESGLFVNGNLHLISQIPLPSADNYERTVNHTISEIIHLNKGDRISLRIRRRTNIDTEMSINGYPTLIISNLD